MSAAQEQKSRLLKERKGSEQPSCKDYNAQERDYVCNCSKADSCSTKEALGSLEGEESY
jgi:hypothetical protein